MFCIKYAPINVLTMSNKIICITITTIWQNKSQRGITISNLMSWCDFCFFLQIQKELVALGLQKATITIIVTKSRWCTTTFGWCLVRTFRGLELPGDEARVNEYFWTVTFLYTSQEFRFEQNIEWWRFDWWAIITCSCYYITCQLQACKHNFCYASVKNG